MPRKRRSAKKQEQPYQQAVIDGANGKIFVGIPRERVFIPTFVDNRDALLAQLQRAGRGVGFYQSESHRVDRNRDSIVKHFLELESKPEWLLQIDTDMEHPHTAPERLAAHGKPIVGALYFHRGKKHDPFVFQRGPDGPDRWGNVQMKWEPMRDEVFDFLEKFNIPMQDGSLTIDNVDYNTLIECDAVATGCLLIHREVLETMEPPWFQYVTEGYSEDLWFCNKAKYDYDIPIYCDISTICGHYHWTPMGQAQFRQVYRNFGVNGTTYSKPYAAHLLSEVLDVPEDKALQMIQSGNASMVGDYWLSKKPETEDEVNAFYDDPHTGKLYLIELLHWNQSESFETIRRGLVPFRQLEILEVGGGIGTVAMQLALQRNNVTMIEPNDLLREFSKVRWNELRGNLWGDIGEITMTKQLEIEPEKYDVAVALDTLEHLPKQTLLETLNNIWQSLKPGGVLAFHANFAQQDLYPMHFDYSDEWEAILAGLGFLLENPVRARKVDRL
jgi:2-polyprenyl-3-methyl-5-hydroxy-6-metoxy-1,4-benzoquinol methylase